MRVPIAKTTALTILFLGCLQILPPPPTHAQRPVQGMPVSELSDLDDIMQDRMEEYDINAAVLGVMKDGKIVYLHGFGWKDEALSEHLPENAMLRIASVTKPFTAAAVRDLIARGVIDLEQQVFQETPGDGGILDYEAWLGVRDQRLYDITVEHLLAHRGGWDRDIVDDLTYREVEIGEALGFDPYHVPSREETVQWIMHQYLQFTPGARREYANVGYLLLGLIVDQVAGMDLYPYLREHIVDESMWFPATEFEPGHTFPGFQNPREPWYNALETWENVFNPEGPEVRAPYGGWNHEARESQGGMVTTAVPILHLLQNYKINDTAGNVQDDTTTIGTPIAAVMVDNWHTGRLRGTESVAKQLTNGVNYVVLLNKRVPGSPTPTIVYVDGFATDIDALVMDPGLVWPTQSVDGEWIDFAYTQDERGTYDEPYNSLDDLLLVSPYTQYRIKPGASTWTGTFRRGPLTLSAPQGSVVIGGTAKSSSAGGSP